MWGKLSSYIVGEVRIQGKNFKREELVKNIHNYKSVLNVWGKKLNFDPNNPNSVVFLKKD